MEFVKICEENYLQVAEIYKEGLATQIATFETTVPDWITWSKKHHTFGRIAIQQHHKICAWASLSPVSTREVYKGVAEVSLYVKASERGKGFGYLILQEFIKRSESNGIWTLQASIFKENEPSLMLHKKCGFRIVGFKEKIARKNGEWKDNIILERRSKNIL